MIYPSYNLETERSFQHLRHADVEIKKDNYKKASYYLDKISSDINHPKFYYLKALTSIILKNFKQTLGNIIKGREINDNSGLEESEKQIYLIKFRILEIFEEFFRTNDLTPDRICKSLKTCISSGSTIKNTQMIFTKIDSISKLFSPKQLNSNQEIGGQIYELFQNITNEKHISDEFSSWSIVSMKWFNQWARFVNFPIKFLEEDSNHPLNYPGPVNSDDIIQSYSNEIIFQKSDHVLNPNQIKTNMRENIEFMILPHAIGKILTDLYDGYSLKRNSIKLPTKQSQIVEIRPIQINLKIIPTLKYNDEDSIISIFISKSDSLGKLISKIWKYIYQEAREGSNDADLRLWLVESLDQYNASFKDVKYFANRMIINHKKLAQDIEIDNLDLDSSSILLAERKVGDDWSLIHEEDVFKFACGNCFNYDTSLKECVCKSIKYCSPNCKKAHFSQHKRRCDEIMYEEKRKDFMNNLSLSPLSGYTKDSNYGLIGLRNLGNTCFMNSSLQSLSNIPHLRDFFLKNEFIQDLNVTNPLGTGGKLATAFSDLLKEIWYGQQETVAPKLLKKVLGQAAEQFSGYNEQDALELLVYLLDNLHEDLNRVKVKPYIEYNRDDNADPFEIAKKDWEYHLMRNKSIIVDLIHGQYKSKLTCLNCKTTSVAFDAFSTISLPIPSRKHIDFNFYFIYKDTSKKPTDITLKLPEIGASIELTRALGEVLGIDPEWIDLYLLRALIFVDENVSRMTIREIDDHKAKLFAYQFYDPKLDSKDFLKEDRIPFEVQFLQRNNDGTTKIASFSRLIFIPEDVDNISIHKECYLLLRGYLKDLFVAEPNSHYYFDIDLNSMESEQINDELQNLNKKSVFKIYYTKKGEELIEITFENAKCNLKSLKKRMIKLVLDSNINQNDLKLNKANKFSGENKKTKEDQSINLYECFELFTKPELLDKDNKWKCTKCKELQTSLKEMNLFRTPQYLIIQLKRFKTSRVHSIGSFYFPSGNSKIDSIVDFPLENLDINPYIFGEANSDNLYDLIAVVNHYGSLNGGHYTAFAKNSIKDKWYLYDDSTVTKVDPKKVISNSAYMLFYQKKNVKN